MGTGDSIMDVGCEDTPVATWGHFKHRYQVNLKEVEALEGVVLIVGSFVDVVVPKVSLVTCLQVLEHVEDPAAFAQKLLATGDRVIASVPYLWPRGACPGHLHDPVRLSMVLDWFGKMPIRKDFVRDGGVTRLVVEFA